MGVAPTRSACVNDALRWAYLLAETAALVVVVPRLLRASRRGRVLVDDSNRGVDGLSGEASTRDVSVVIPARNEANRIKECILPLRDAPRVREVIVVDDESTDATAAVARELGATVVRGAALPSGWAGKIWALQQGIDAASSEFIVTLDADARPSPALPGAAVEALLQSGAVFATVAPKFRSTTAMSQWLHASMLTSLVYRHGAGAGRADRDSVANGQCMVFRGQDATNGEWCRSVRGETIEDVALVRRLAREGRHVEMFDGHRLLTVQMFEGFVDTWRGWGRSLALSSVDRPSRQWLDAIVTLIALVLPIWLLASGVATPVSGVLLLLRVGTLLGTVRVYERPGLGYWLSPLADLLAWFVVVRGIISPSRQWRGREY